MARIKCFECGNIFPLNDGPIQICPKCNAKMRINNSNPSAQQSQNKELPKEELRNESPSDFVSEPEDVIETPFEEKPGEDEYSSIRNEYADLMRKQIEEGSTQDEPMVMIPKRIYDALVSGAILRRTQEMSGEEVTPSYSEEPVAAVSEEPAAEEPRKKPKYILSLILVLIALAATAVTLFLTPFQDKSFTVLEKIQDYLGGSDSIIGWFAVGTYGLIALFSVIFVFARKTKFGKILAGLFYFFEAAGMAFVYALFEALRGNADIEYLKFWFYLTAVMTVIVCVLAFVGIALFASGCAQKRKV